MSTLLERIRPDLYAKHLVPQPRLVPTSPPVVKPEWLARGERGENHAKELEGRSAA